MPHTREIKSLSFRRRSGPFRLCFILFCFCLLHLKWAHEWERELVSWGWETKKNTKKNKEQKKITETTNGISSWHVKFSCQPDFTGSYHIGLISGLQKDIDYEFHY